MTETGYLKIKFIQLNVWCQAKSASSPPMEVCERILWVPDESKLWEEEAWRDGEGLKNAVWCHNTDDP